MSAGEISIQNKALPAARDSHSWRAADGRLTQYYRSCRFEELNMLSRGGKQSYRNGGNAVASAGGGGTGGCESGERRAAGDSFDQVARAHCQSYR
jgi:hypothetical protein